MKSGKYLALFAGVVMLLPLSAFARQKNEGTLKLYDRAEIGSTRLEPGTYKVEWTGTGSNVQVSLLQHKKTVVTTAAQLKTNDPGITQDAVVLRTAANEAAPKQIAEIDFGSQKEALVLTDQIGQDQGQ